MKGAQIDSNCWDRHAKLVIGKQELKLHKHFEDLLGPNTEELINTKGTILDQLALDVEQRMDIKRKVDSTSQETEEEACGTKRSISDTLDANMRAKRRLLAKAKATGQGKGSRTLIGNLAI